MTQLHSFMFVAIVVFLLLLQAGRALAANLFEPRITLAGEYNDNLFLQETDGGSDWIATIEPGLRLKVETRPLDLDLDYALRFRQYHEHSELDETDFNDVQRAMLGATLFPERDFTVLLRDEITRVVIDERNPNATENEVQNKTNLDHWIAMPSYRWRALPTFDATFSYQFERYDYRSPLADDATLHSYNIALEKELADNTRLRTVATYRDYRSDDGSDYQVERGAAGFARPFGPAWKLSAEGGYARISFENQADEDEIVWMARVDGRLTPRTDLVLLSDREFVASVDAGATRRSQARADLNYRGRASLMLALFAREDSFLSVDRTDRSLGAELRGELPLAGQFVLVGHGDFARYRFLPERETSDRTGAGASLDYVARKLRVSLGYSWRVNDSDIDTHDYTNNIAGLTISLRI